MNLEFTTSFMFAFHVTLFFVKAWALYIIFKLLILVEAPNTEKYMLVFKPIEIILFIFSIVVLISEIYFIYGFFINETFYNYEYLAMTDQMFFTILTINYIKTEVKNNGN